MAEIQEINLHIDGEVFTVKKDVLCRHSDYFCAMFSGNYVETEQRNITIDTVGTDSMNIILRYMDSGSLDLTEYTVPVLNYLAKAANFFQITELLKQIEHYLDSQITVSNCMEILDIAEQCSYMKLEHLTATSGLLSFKSMKPEYIPTIDRLLWYLSHPYLDADNELDVFKFGFDWMSQTQTGGDALLVILGCLDVKRITCSDINQMCLLSKDHKHSLVEGVINCLEQLCTSGDISLDAVTTNRSVLCEKFTKQTYTETYNIVKESKERKLKYMTVIQKYSQENSEKRRILNSIPSQGSEVMLCKYTENIGMEDWLKVPKKKSFNLPQRKYCRVAAWGNTKLVVSTLHSNEFIRDVIIYDVLRKEWIDHGVELPPVFCTSIAVVDDLLYIVEACEPGILPTSIVYNLNERTYKQIAASPEKRANLHLCSHKGSIYAARIPKTLYVYESGVDTWRQLPINEGQYGDYEISSLVSFNEYLYCCSDGHFILRIRPEIDDTWELISLGRQDVSTRALCSLRTHLLVFLEERFSNESQTPSSEYDVDYLFVLDPQITYKTIAGSCILVLDLPSSLRTETSQYHHKYLSNL